MRIKKSLAAGLVGLAAVSLFTACSSEDPQPDGPQTQQTPVSTVGATDGAAEPGEPTTGEPFAGEVSTEVITANMMEIEIPTGLRIPEDSLVTQALPASIMIADEDPTAVTEAIETSTAEAGYEVYAEVTGGKVFVGHGNAVLFTAAPNVQIITWGPEAMKDVLSQG